MIGFSLTISSCRKDPLAPLGEVIPDDDGDNGNGGGNGGNGTDNSQYGFETTMDPWTLGGTAGWEGFIYAEISSEQAKYGSHSLKIHAAITNGSASRGQGILKLDLGAGTDFSNKTIIFWIRLPIEAYGPDPVGSQNAVGFILSDSASSWDQYYVNLQPGTENTWLPYTVDVSTLMGNRASDLQEIRIFFAAWGAGTAFEGDIYVDAVDWSTPDDPSIYKFEVSHQGWGDVTMTGGFKSRAQTTEKAYLGTGSLKINCELTNGPGPNNIGDIKATTGGLDLTGSTTLVYWLWIPSELYGTNWGSNPNKLNPYIQGANFPPAPAPGWQWYDTWINLNDITDADKWTKYTLDLSGVAAVDIQEVNAIGFRFSIDAANTTAFKGAIYLDAVDTEL